VISPYLEIGQFLTVFYFFIVFLLFPLNNIFEKLIYDVYIWRGDAILKFNDGRYIVYLKTYKFIYDSVTKYIN